VPVPKFFCDWNAPRYFYYFLLVLLFFNPLPRGVAESADGHLVRALVIAGSVACAEVGGVFCVLFMRADGVEVVEFVCFVVGPFNAIINGLFAYPTWRVGFDAVLFELFAELVEASCTATI